MDIVCQLLRLYVLVIIARIVLSFFRVPSDHPVGRLTELLARLVDPLLDPIRRVVPPLGAGGMGLDLSPLILLIAIQIVAGVICR